MISFNNNVFHLATEDTSYIIGVVDGQLLNLYFGKRINNVPDLEDMLPIKFCRSFSCNDIFTRGFSCSTDNLTMEYPTFGSADLRTPAFCAKYSDGTFVTRFSYEDYEIVNGKYELCGLPSVYAEESDKVSSLKIILKDNVYGVTAELHYAVFEEYNAITRSVKIINSGEKPFYITKVLSLSVDFRRADFDIITLNGAWARERIPERTPMSFGTHQVESMRGITSHHENPFFALVDKKTDEFSGEAYGFNLIYSGNFIAGAQRDAYDVTRAFLGINPHGFSWSLNAGESFTAPEAVLVYSDNGIGKMSRKFHKLYRERLCRGKYRDIRRPVLINNWEATYFDFDEEKILGIAKTAKSVGVELMVLDDGWFGTRNSDNCSLGDWTENRKKLPNGVGGLAKKVKELGMSFGLWVEPEMVSPDSDLYRAHPDWCLHIDGRACTFGRNQLVLDLTRKEVVDFIKSVFDRLLESGDILYIKWDMNRSMTEVGSSAVGAAQGRVYHAYVLALYSIMDYVTKTYPDVLFEGCSGGGGRFDGGILHYFPQIWTSDDTDALERIYIQYGTSMCYPYSAMGAHVSAVPNHQVYRTTPMKMRGDVSICGQLGYELDLNKLNNEDIEYVKKQIADYKDLSEVFHKGELYRLLTPVGNNAAVNEFISENKETIIVCTYILKGIPNAPIHYVKLSSLEADAEYTDQNGKRYSGEYLMNFGIGICYEADYKSEIIVLKKVI